MAKSLKGLRILVLEDEFLIALDVEQTCRDFGAVDVQIAHTIDIAETMAAKGMFDAAIVDIMLGGSSTLDFARRLRDRRVPFVFASGYTDPQELDGQFPGVGVVTKPFGGDDLVDAVLNAIDRNASIANG